MAAKPEVGGSKFVESQERQIEDGLRRGYCYRHIKEMVQPRPKQWQQFRKKYYEIPRTLGSRKPTECPDCHTAKRGNIKPPAGPLPKAA